jgi:formate/nitrite transporter FocA (FNT family)
LQLIFYKFLLIIFDDNDIINIDVLKLSEYTKDKRGLMKIKDVVVFILLGIFAGAAISIGGTASLLACNLLSGMWGKFVGALLFSLGMFVVITYGLKLFTGMVSGIPTMGVKNVWQLPVCFLANALGCIIFALIVRNSFIGETLVKQAQSIISGKLGDDYWAIKTFCSAIACGILITFSVWSPRYTAEKKLSASIGVMLPIVVFVFCGFDHSVADVFYLCLDGNITWQAVGYIALAVAGNIVGGVLFPLAALLFNKK